MVFPAIGGDNSSQFMSGPRRNVPPLVTTKTWPSIRWTPSRILAGSRRRDATRPKISSRRLTRMARLYFPLSSIPRVFLTVVQSLPNRAASLPTFRNSRKETRLKLLSAMQKKSA